MNLPFFLAIDPYPGCLILRREGGAFSLDAYYSQFSDTPKSIRGSLDGWAVLPFEMEGGVIARVI